MNLSIEILTSFFENNTLKEEYSYFSFISKLQDDFNMNLEDILNQLFTLYEENKDFIILDSIFSCMQINEFNNINLEKFSSKYNKYFLDIFKNIFLRHEYSYLNFPLSQFTDNINTYLSISNLMIKNNTAAASFICNQGLNKVSLIDKEYPTFLQNKILDLKLTCSIFK